GKISMETENQFPANLGRPFLGLLTNSSDSHIMLAVPHLINCQLLRKDGLLKQYLDNLKYYENKSFSSSKIGEKSVILANESAHALIN
ncbi:hypothetical protein BpHYR1_000514, partial [Brachionus plicatilis]